MATQTQNARAKNQDDAQLAEDTVERIRQLNERIIDGAKKAGNMYLDAYEKSLESIADFEQQVADASKVEWVSAIANAHSRFIRDVAESYSRAAREVLK